MRAPPTINLLPTESLAPIGGTPLIPPSYLTVYFLIFLLFLTILYTYLYRKKRPAVLWRKIRLLLVTAFLLKVTFIVGGGALAFYWLIPSPSIRRTTPIAEESSFTTTQRVEIVFDRPVNRQALEKSISPEVPGKWVFEDSIYTTHLYRRLVFYPTESLNPDTRYTVNLSNIQNMIALSEPYEFIFNFKTQQTPLVKEVSPHDSQNKVDTNAKIIVFLTKANNNVSEFSFIFDPPISFQTTYDNSAMSYTLTPQEPFKQGVQYHLNVQKSDVRWNLEEAYISERGASAEVYKGSFTTKEAPEIVSFEPPSTNAAITSAVTIQFTQEMDKKSVQDNFLISPKVEGNFSWVDEHRLVFKPRTLAYDTDYSVTVGKGARSKEGFFEEDIVKTFKTIGPVRVTTTNPQSGLTAINVNTPISFTFNQEVDHASTEEKFTVSPEVEGSFKWDGNTIIFIPSSPLKFSTSYTASLATNVKSTNGQNSNEEFNVNFVTQNTSTKLGVPVYLQKYTLSCEIASLRMALNYKGAGVTEDELIPKVGSDLTPHDGNIWGDPNKAFVGAINGTQMKNGYGVHWGPIAKAARNYRNATDFQGWTVEQLTNEIILGNPIVIWVYSHFGIKTTWRTPGGDLINAVRDEHAVVAVGFVGPASNPTQLIINDPLSGQVYWSRTNFDKKWGIFGNSGVVIY